MYDVTVVSQLSILSARHMSSTLSMQLVQHKLPGLLNQFVQHTLRHVVHAVCTIYAPVSMQSVPYMSPCLSVHAVTHIVHTVCTIYAPMLATQSCQHELSMLSMQSAHPAGCTSSTSNPSSLFKAGCTSSLFKQSVQRKCCAAKMPSSRVSHRGEDVRHG